MKLFEKPMVEIVSVGTDVIATSPTGGGGSGSIDMPEQKL